jgi:hypothetical protein
MMIVFDKLDVCRGVHDPQARKPLQPPVKRDQEAVAPGGKGGDILDCKEPSWQGKGHG